MTKNIFIIVSKTQVSLWENKVPDKIYQVIKEECNIKTRKEVESLHRHNCIVIDAFCDVYGEYLERCEYAAIKEIPILFRDFYRVVQIPIYGNSMNPETIELKVEESLIFYRKTDVYRQVEDFLGGLSPYNPLKRG